MAGIYKRAADKARGVAGKYTCWWTGEDGRRKTCVGSTDAKVSRQIANGRDDEARKVREGLVDPRERTRREAGLKPVARHVEDYRLGLLARGDSAKHAGHVAGAITRLLDDATIASVSDLSPGRLQEALGRMRAARSPRTTNHALRAVKAFAVWLEHNHRIAEVPRGLAAIKPYSEEVGRVRVRRALRREEVERLLAATEAGPPVRAFRDRAKGVTPGGKGACRSSVHRAAITGPMRAALYRLAMGTGFRAEEIRSLTPESFVLDGDEPTVTVEAAYSKNGKRAVQPITRDLAARLGPHLAAVAPGDPAFLLPHRTAEMLRDDLAAAGIEAVTKEGVVDFHSLRHTYVTHLIQSGATVAEAQKLARHSTPTLTIGRYSHADAGDLRRALDRGEGEA